MKKKQQPFKTSFVLGLFLIVFLCSSAFGQDQKVISKSYKTSSTVQVELSNKYGDIKITPWDKNQLDIKIEISAQGRDENRTSNILDQIDVRIDDSSPNSYIGFFTKINSISTRFNENFKINYYVRVPDHAELSVKNQYGDLFIGRHFGDVKLNLSYQDLIKIDGLLGKNDIRISYSDNVHIGEINTAESFRVSYSELKIDKAGSISYRPSYTETEIGTVDKLDLKAGNGELSIKKVNQIEGSFSYTEIEIGKLSNSMELKGVYGGDFEIDHVLASVKELELSVQYTDVEINLNEDLDASFYARTSFGDIDFSQKFIKCNYINKQNFAKEFKGKIGAGKKGKIHLTGSYSDFDIQREE